MDGEVFESERETRAGLEVEETDFPEMDETFLLLRVVNTAQA